MTDFWERSTLPVHPLEILTLCGLDSLLGIAHYLGQDPPGYQALPSFETVLIFSTLPWKPFFLLDPAQASGELQGFM